MSQISRPFLTRSFYLLLLAAWAGAVGIMYITAVWGGLQGLLDQTVVPRAEGNLSASLDAGKKMVSEATSRLKGQVPAQAQRVPDQTYRQMLASDLLAGAERLEGRVEKTFGLDGRRTAEQAPGLPASALPAPSLPAATAAPAAGPQVSLRSADFDSDSSRFIMTLHADTSSDKVTWFTMDNPRRLVLDLHGRWKTGLRRVNDLPGGFINSVHVGDHPDYVRFVCFFADRQSTGKVAPNIMPTPDGVTVFVLNPK